MGYDKENLVCLDLQGNMREKFSVIRNDLLASGAVVEAATGSSSPLEIGSSSGNYEWEGKDPTKEVLISMSGVTPQYFATAGIQLKEGRTFYDSPTQDTNSVIINETFAKIIGKKDPIGTILHSDDRNLEVIGVVKDFIFNDMYKEPDPAIFYKDPEWASTLFIRLKSHQDISKALAKVETVLKNDAPGYPFDYQFLDASFRERFKSEMLIGNLSKIFAAFAIFISCLGLFGLAAFTAEQRTKEIGIRKVLGATVSDIVSLLSKDFLLLVLIAAVIAFPLAWYFMHHWLQDFAYRIGIEWWVFVAAGAVALLIALFTVSFQAVRAALANPADSLKTE